MQYFFDESGDWSGREKHRLVLGGLLIAQAHELAVLDTGFRLLKAQHNLGYLHANEMSAVALEDCYQTILASLKRSGSALIRIYRPDVLNRSTRKTKDDVYIDLAAELISTMIFGDSKPEVNYDMKFHYAYPENIIMQSRIKKPYHYKRVMEAHQLRQEKYEEEQKRIVGKLANMKKSAKERAQWYVNELEKDGMRAVSEYLWAELMLQIEGKEKAREDFRKAILDNLKQASNYDKEEKSPDQILVSYFAKDQGNAGIEMIDILCNLVYRYGGKAPAKASATIKQIYDVITIEEM